MVCKRLNFHSLTESYLWQLIQGVNIIGIEITNLGDKSVLVTYLKMRLKLCESLFALYCGIK